MLVSELRNASFPENFAYVLNGWTLITYLLLAYYSLNVLPDALSSDSKYRKKENS